VRPAERRWILGVVAWALALQGCTSGSAGTGTGGLASAPPPGDAGLAALFAPLGLPGRQHQAPTLDSARRLQYNGETDAARDAFEALLSQGATTAAAARLQLAVLALDDGQPAQATTHLTTLVRDYPGAAERPGASYLLGVAARRQGDAGGAVARFQEYLGLNDRLSAYAHLELADLQDRAGDLAQEQAEAEGALAGPGSRRLRIEALERLAHVADQRDDLAAAQARWEEIWPLAATTSYRAEVLWQIGSLARRRGDAPGAAARFQKIVVDYPATSRAADALRGLNELGLADAISDYQAGLVRFDQGDYGRAISGFDAQLAAGGSDDELAAASYYRAVAMLRQGRESAARAALDAVAQGYPASSFAAEALYRLAWLQESAGQYGAAAESYQTLAGSYSQSPPGQLALFRGGFALRRAGDYEQALAAWEAALPTAAGQVVRSAIQGQALHPRAAILYWMGKTLALLGRQDEARARWESAAAAGPDDYYGLRARAILAGDDDAPTTNVDGARLAPPRPDDALAAWLAAAGADAGALAAELQADPAWQRGAALWALGRRDQAQWEFDDLADRFAHDPPRLYVLGTALRDLGADYLALAAGRRLWTASGAASVFDLPRAVRGLLYPAAYGDLVAAQAARWKVDPYLLLALIRQESSFNPRAESGASARGLTQVVPSTGRGIARAVGRGSFDADDLFKPAVSIEFGAYYLSQALAQFQGAIYPALAGYNAGPGTAAAWLRNLGAFDPDLYAEQIPYAETSTYVRRVYENYRLYRDLYGG